MRDHILFYLNGQCVKVSGNEVFLTLSDFLRKQRGLTGTKVVCAEGDCGSCTVLVGRPATGKLEYVAVTSCIQILFQLDASHVVTVEGLRDGETLNPVQQAMVDCHGTQCGFCTPGFVVSLHGLMTDGSEVNRAKVCRGLTGNLCRCTGYDSIVRAAISVDRTKVRPVADLYSSPQMYADLASADREEVQIQTADRRFCKPVSVPAASQYRLNNPGCAVIAGGTDLGVVYNKRIREITTAMSLAGLASLRQTKVESDVIQMGAGCTLTTLQAMAHKHLPELGKFMEWFGSPLIRNAGTVGGNVVTGSPIGDTISALTALEAEIVIEGLTAQRVVPIERFYTGYRQTVLADDELVTAVRIPLLGSSQLLKLYKVSRRKDLDISSFGAAIWVQRLDGIIEDIRLAFGGVGPMVMRMPQAEAMLRGKTATLENFERAGELAGQEVKPISDVRGSADYRRTLARNILIKFWHEAINKEAPDVCPGLLV